MISWLKHLVPTWAQLKQLRRVSAFPLSTHGFSLELLSSAFWVPRGLCPSATTQAVPHRLECPHVCHKLQGPDWCLSRALGEFPSTLACLVDLTLPTSTAGCSPSPPVFTENFSGIYCSLLPLGCWSADSQRVVFDSAQRSRQVRDTDGVEGQPLWSTPRSPAPLRHSTCMPLGEMPSHKVSSAP